MTLNRRSIAWVPLFAASLLPACMRHQNQPTSPTEPRNSIVVVGEGEARAKPDIVKIQLGVEARARDAREAVDATNKKTLAVTQALKALGVPTADIQTSEFNIAPDFVPPGTLEEMDRGQDAPRAGVGEPVAPEPLAPAGASMQMAPMGGPPPFSPPGMLVYRASNMLHVTVRDPSQVGNILSGAVSAGANQAWGVSFDVADDGPLSTAARAAAMADARAQALELAKLGGVKLGRIVAIVDPGTGNGPMPMPMPAAAMMGAGPVPVESGQLVLRRQVRVVFAIER